MPSNVPSEADRELVRRLRRAGLAQMTEARLERWQKAGLMITATQVRVPGRRGSSSVYPDGAYQQALALGRILERHRSFDKTAVLLFLHGYPIEVKALRRSLAHGLDHLEGKIDRYRGNQTDPEAIALAVAQGILSEPLRRREERAWRRKQIEDAGGEDKLRLAYARLFRVFIGRADVGGFLAGMSRMGFGVREKLGLDEQSSQQLQTNIAGQIDELNQHGGLGPLLRSALPQLEPQRLGSLRSFMQEATQWTVALGVSLDTPSLFWDDIHKALLNPDRPAITPDDKARPTPPTEPGEGGL